MGGIPCGTIVKARITSRIHATEVMAYYIAQAEKVASRYHAPHGKKGIAKIIIGTRSATVVRHLLKNGVDLYYNGQKCFCR